PLPETGGRRRRKRGRFADRRPDEQLPEQKPQPQVAAPAPAPVSNVPAPPPSQVTILRSEDELSRLEREKPRDARVEREYKEILINVEERETRIAVLENGRLVELHVEREERVVGGVYKGRVSNVLPG